MTSSLVKMKKKYEVRLEETFCSLVMRLDLPFSSSSTLFSYTCKSSLFSCWCY